MGSDPRGGAAQATVTGTDHGVGGQAVRQYEWRKANRSGAQGDNCVEVATNVPDVVAVRDSKHPDGPVLEVSPAQWRQFLADLGR